MNANINAGFSKRDFAILILSALLASQGVSAIPSESTSAVQTNTTSENTESNQRGQNSSWSFECNQ